MLKRGVVSQFEFARQINISISFDCCYIADSDEAGRDSDLKPATQRLLPRIEAMMFPRGGLVKWMGF
jgi:hypothetical protein